MLDVAALLRARTKDINGDEVGTFNDDTRPMSAQVLRLIDEAVGDIQARMGRSPPPELLGVFLARQLGGDAEGATMAHPV